MQITITLNGLSITSLTKAIDELTKVRDRLKEAESITVPPLKPETPVANSFTGNSPRF